MHDLTQSQLNDETSTHQTYKSLLDAELFRVERKSQEQTGWFMAICLVPIYIITLFQTDVTQVDYRRFIDIIVWVMLVWFIGNALLIRQGYYHRSLKYINVIFQITMASFFILVSAQIMGPKIGLSSVTPLYYVVVIGVSSLTMNPFLCLLAGGVAAAQIVGLYYFWFRDALFGVKALQERDFSYIDQQYALYGWASIMIIAILFVIIGVAAMLMARKARALLETVVVQVRYEEQLNFLERDISHAAEVQNRLIPVQHPDFPRLDIASWYQPSKEVGGDYFDFIERPNGNKLVLIADVAGKGFSAAMLMSNIQAMIQVLAQQDITIEELANIVNQSVIKTSAQGRFISMVYFEFYPDQEYFRYLNCGHNPPVLLKQNQAIQILEANAPVLGVTDSGSCAAQNVDFNNEDIIFAYTDGLSELRSEQRELFGESRIEDMLGNMIGLETDAIKAGVLHKVNRFLGSALPTDDLSFLIIKKMAAS